mgnify:CR=1 FL=1
MSKFQKGNKFSVGLTNNGRPPLYASPEDMVKKCEDYFSKETKFTITGLCLHLGFASRNQFYEYGKKGDFKYIIKRASMVVEQGYEQMFHEGSNSGIFPLKNMGWIDKQEVQQTVENITPLSEEEIQKAKDKLNGEI